MDFSVRQLDSSQRRCVFSQKLGSASYTCLVDGKYDVYLTLGLPDRFGNSYTEGGDHVVGYYNGSNFCNLGPGSLAYADTGAAVYYSNSASYEFYCSNGEYFSFRMFNDSGYTPPNGLVEIYLTPYK